MRSTSIVFPAPGGPTIIMWWAPAAAISTANLAVGCPAMSAMSFGAAGIPRAVVLGAGTGSGAESGRVTLAGSAPKAMKTSARLAKAFTVAWGTSAASPSFPAATTNRVCPAFTPAITAGSTPLTGRSLPSSPTSAMNTVSSQPRTSPAAASAAITIARSKLEPRLCRDAGMRFTVIFRRLRGSPAFRAAALIRSRASFSDASGSPRITKAGRVWPMSASTSTM